MLKIIVFVKSTKLFHCKKKKKIHKVMLSDVIVNIFNSHMPLYLNIMKAQGYILLRLFPFSQNRHSYHKALLPGK